MYIYQIISNLCVLKKLLKMCGGFFLKFSNTEVKCKKSF